MHRQSFSIVIGVGGKQDKSRFISAKQMGDFLQVIIGISISIGASTVHRGITAPAFMFLLAIMFYKKCKSNKRPQKQVPVTFAGKLLK